MYKYNNGLGMSRGIMQNQQKMDFDRLKDGQPRYVEAYRKLLNIVIGMKPGEKLHTEEAMAGEFGMSRNTLRQALQMLQEDKLIYKRDGVGTFVSGVPYLGKSNLCVYQPEGDRLKNSGLEAVVSEFALSLEAFDGFIAGWLEVKEGTDMYFASRIYESRSSPDICYSYCEDYIPAGKGFSAERSGREGFVREYEAAGQASICNITVAKAGAFHGKKLKIDAGVPIIVLQQIVLDDYGRKIYLNKTYLNTELPENSVLVNRLSPKIEFETKTRESGADTVKR